MSTFELSPGVVVDTDRGAAYLMSPEGGVVAVDLAEGTQIWRSNEAAKPLALAGGLLVGQAEAVGPGDLLRIVALNPEAGGAVTRSAVPLPAGVQPMIEQTPGRSFTARAEAVAGEAVVGWEFVEQPLRGVAPGPLEVLPGETPPATLAMAHAPAEAPVEPGEAIVIRGAVRVALTDGTVTPITDPTTEAAPAAAAPGGSAAPLVEAHLPGVPEPQFLSADGRHVMSSRRVADDSEWNKYLWSLFDRETGNAIGEFRTHVRYAPFFVEGGRVVFQTMPFERQTPAGPRAEPMQVRAADLTTGELVWSQPLRDIVDRDPPP